MGYASLISSALGGFTSNIMSIATADRRAHQVKQQYETQARLAEYNRQIAENQAVAARQMQEHQLEMADIEGKKAHNAALEAHDTSTALQERKLAIMAKSGVTSAGTPILVQQEAVADAITKQNDIIWRGGQRGHQYKISAWNYANRATMFDSQAQMAQYQADVARSIGKYRSKMIKFQKNLTIAKMFYDPSNVTTFGEVDNPQQFQHFNMGTLSSIGSFGGGGRSAISNGYGSSSAVSSMQYDNPQGAGQSLIINNRGSQYA